MVTNLKIGYGGRLGNQIFQYAMLMGVANKLKTNIKLPVYNSTVTKEEGCLDLYTNKWIPYRFILNECFDLKINWMLDYDFISVKNIHKEQFFHYDESVFNCSDNTNFDGYYQSYKYFEHIMPEIRSTFKFWDNIQKKAQGFHDSVRQHGQKVVSIHVRRGDYLGIPDILPVCEPEYYEEALSHFEDDDYVFLVCSDDIQWCINTFGNGDNIFYPVDNDPYTDLCAMSMCDHNIIPNSTFSWWAAMLNNNPDKRVVAPKRWFGPKLQENKTTDLLPEEWIKI